MLKNDPVAEEIRRLASPCPICGKQRLEEDDGHQYALFASEIARDRTGKLQSFFDLYKARRWAELRAIQNFEGTANAALIYAFKCEARTAMLALRDPYELHESYELLDLVLLKDEEAQFIRSLPVIFSDI